MSRQAMQQALEALEALEVLDRVMQRSERTNSAITALRQALAEPEQSHTLTCVCGAEWDIHADGREELVAAPTPRKPVELTDEECDAIYEALDDWAREFHRLEFGLPRICGGGAEGGRVVIRRALGITGEQT